MQEIYIIVDDFIDTGHTVKFIQKEIYSKISTKAKCLGVLSVQELEGTDGGYRNKLQTTRNLTRKELKG